MPELQDKVAGAQNRQRPKELEGVGRFVKGMRNKAGKRDDDLDKHMKYQLFVDEDKTWKNDIRVAARWEAAKDKSMASSSSSESSESSSDDTSRETTSDNEAAAMRKKPKKGKNIKKQVNKEQRVATLIDQVENNTVEIQSVRSSMEQHMAECESLF
jgi:transcription initiation factor IIF auxiliary subunit